jgi:hypothetical protein
VIRVPWSRVDDISSVIKLHEGLITIRDAEHP